MEYYKSLKKVILSVAIPILTLASSGFGQTLTVLNAASQSSGRIAPGSIVAIFGTTLTVGVSSAPSAMNPPSTLGGVTVTIGGAPPRLFYPSPGQINPGRNPSAPA